MKNYCLILSMILLAGCFQAYNEDDDLRVVPITNNPHIVPSHGSMIPGVAGQTQY